MKRRPLPPDTRPDWRDPDMPCVRTYTMTNGSILSVVDADFERRFREHLMQVSVQPHFLSDPTYNLKRKK